MGTFVGLDGVSREVKDIFIGIDGKAMRVKTGFIGIDGKATVFYGGFYQPADNEVVVSLNTGEWFNSDKTFAAGRYKVQIAGSVGLTSDNCFTVTTTMTEPFKILAFLNDGSTEANAFVDSLNVNGAGTIFGGRGGKNASGSTGSSIPSAPTASVAQGGAIVSGGACCHFLPRKGVFGTDYLRCFHCGAGASGYGGGGAYGGGAGGRGARYYYRPPGTTGRTYPINYTGGTGISGAGGAGGAGGYGTVGDAIGGGTSVGVAGSPGSGIGAGTATQGGVAYYNGSSWSEPTRQNNSNQVPFIIVTYLGK